MSVKTNEADIMNIFQKYSANQYEILLKMGLNIRYQNNRLATPK